MCFGARFNARQYLIDTGPARNAEECITRLARGEAADWFCVPLKSDANVEERVVGVSEDTAEGVDNGMRAGRDIWLWRDEKVGGFARIRPYSYDDRGGGGSDGEIAEVCTCL